MIDHQDFMHGAALAAIARHRNFVALNKASPKYGHFKVNDNCHIFIKYDDEGRSGRDGTVTYNFGFSHSEIREMQKTKSSANQVYTVLVCGQEAITALSLSQLSEIIDMKAAQQSVRVVSQPPKWLRIYGSARRLGPPVPRTGRAAFPNQILSRSNHRAMRAS
jgi:hypothetical protein